MKLTFLSGALLGCLGLATAAPDPRYSYTVHAGAKAFPPSPAERRSLHERQQTCAAPVDIEVTAPKANPFVALSQDEIDAVAAWLLAPAQGLNLTNSSDPKLALSDNYIWHIQALKPNKTDVLSYLDANGTVPRYARVALIQGGLKVPVVAEYSVSPSLQTSISTVLRWRRHELILSRSDPSLYLMSPKSSPWTICTMAPMVQRFFGALAGWTRFEAQPSTIW